MQNLSAALVVADRLVDFKYLGATSRTGGKGPRQAKGKESKKRFVRPEGKTTEPKPPRKAVRQGSKERAIQATE